MEKFIIQDEYKNWRFDKFLTEKLGQTRSQVQKQIKSDTFLINGKKPSVHQFLNTGDVVEIKNQKSKIQSITDTIKKTVSKTIAKTNPEKTPNILIKEKDYLVIEKPAGLLVHSTHETHTELTLVDWLIKKFPGIKKVGDPVSLLKEENIFRPGILHRLDRDVSGLMIVARTQKGFDYFKKEFKLKNVKKEYIALASGVISKDEDKLIFPIARSRDGKLVALPVNSEKGKSAATEFDVLQRFHNHTLIKLNLLTGRTNQIRIHLSAYNHPLVGDKVYASNKFQRIEKIKLKRVFLHAQRLEFTDPSGNEVKIESSLPEELDNIIKNLK